jgi:membrane protease YdiL (CAAX protease family)
MKLTMTFGKRMLLFALLTVFGLFVTALLSSLISAMTDKQTLMLRLVAVCQNLFLFILPAVAVAVLTTRLPARLLALDRRPSLLQIALALGALVASVPAMNVVVDWNASLPLPGALTEMEDTADMTTTLLLGGRGMADLVLSLLIVGVLTGLGEELFFRGALMRLIQTRPMSAHAAVWITAVVFSAIHMQFGGFIPRMLLGAYLGYLLLWSGSVWLPVLVHMVNNSISVWARWSGNETLETVGTASSDYWIVVVSVVIAGVLIQQLYRRRVNQTSSDGK